MEFYCNGEIIFSYNFKLGDNKLEQMWNQLKHQCYKLPQEKGTNMSVRLKHQCYKLSQEKRNNLVFSPTD